MFLTNSDDLAIIDGDKRISHRQVAMRAQQLSTNLQLKANTIIAIFSENRRGWIYAFYASWLAKCTVVPVDFMATAKEVSHILNDCSPEVIFVSKNMQSALDQALAISDSKPRVVLIDEFEDYELSSNTQPAFRFTPDEEDVAVIIYTSGTTGSPKGVMLTYNNLLSNILSVSVDVKILDKSDVTLVVLPLHHIFPLLGSMIAPLHLGGVMAMCPTMNPEDILHTLDTHKVTVVIGVPRLYAAFRKGIMEKINSNLVAQALFLLAQIIQTYSFSKYIFKKVHKKFGGHIKYMISGGAALDTNIGQDFKTLGFKILEGYGMTEAAPMITFTHPNDIIVGSVGKTPPSMTIKIIDGEIIAKGSHIMKGYYNRPKETKEILKNGWLHTGDLGHIDSNNNVYITGRKKELIVLSNGKNINPLTIEQEIEEKWSAIKEIGLFVKNDQLHGIIVPNLQVCAKLKVIEIEEYIRHEIIEKYNSNTASYKKIFHFSLTMGELPRTRLGKLQRFKLALLEENKIEEEDENEPDFAELIILKEYLEKEKKIDVKAKHHIELDLGLDSLEKVSFQAFIESTFGLKLEIGEIINFGNVLELAHYLTANRSKMEIEEINWRDILNQSIELKLPKVWPSIYALLSGSKLLLKLYFEMRCIGQENIPPAPCIIIANHQSYLDGVIVASHLNNKQIAQTLYYAKSSNFRRKWQQFVAKKHNAIVLDKNKNLKESILMMAEGLKQGKNIVIFPEGTRTATGRLGVFKKTYAILASELNVPIVPAVIKGSFEALPKGAAIPKFNQPISIEFLSPICANGRDYNEVNDEVRQMIKHKLH